MPEARLFGSFISVNPAHVEPSGQASDGGSEETSGQISENSEDAPVLLQAQVMSCAQAFLKSLSLRTPLETAAETLCESLAGAFGLDSCLLLLNDDWELLMPASRVAASPAEEGFFPASGVNLLTRQARWLYEERAPWSPFVIQALFEWIDASPESAPLIIPDLGADALLPQSMRSYFRAQHVKSLGIWRLYDAAGATAGHLLLLGRRPGSWHEIACQALTQSGEWIAMGLSMQSQLLEQRRALRRERLVGKIMGYLNQTFNVQSILGLICKDIARALGADRCLILQYDSASESLPVQYMGQYCAHSGIEPVQRDDLPSEAILYSLNGQIVSNAPCARLAQQIQDFNDRYGAQSSAAVQMVFRGAPMGMILTQQCDRLRVWDEDDMALLHTLAMELGGAFYLAELFRLTEQAGLEAATASERKNRALASFAHELRSPLHTVISCAELMKDDLFVQQPEKRREYAALSEKSARYLLSLINDMLDAARIETGGFSVRGKTFNLHAAVLDAVEMIQPQCDQKRQRLRALFPRALPSVYVGDPIRIRQALINLLANAHQYTPEGGEITVSAIFHPKSPDSLRLKDSEQCVSIHIADTGCGLSAEDAENVFRPFYQVNPEDPASKKGLGLGLSIAKSIVELHGASLSLGPREGGGVEAVLTLPLCGAVRAAFAETPDSNNAE